jgi:hypothetical protein
MAFSERLPHACPDCNGCVNFESMICEGCGLEVLPHPTTVPGVYALLSPDRRIGDVDAFIDDVLGWDSS